MEHSSVPLRAASFAGEEKADRTRQEVGVSKQKLLLPTAGSCPGWGGTMGPVLCPVSALFTLHPIPSFLQESMLFFWTLPTVGDEMCVHTDLENPVPAHCWQHQQCREMPAAPGWSPKNFKQPGWCPPSPPCPTAVPIQDSALGDTRATHTQAKPRVRDSSSAGLRLTLLLDGP